jgi:hypothetical protein
MHFRFFRCPEGSKQVLFCEGATKGIVQNMTTLFFMGGGPAKGATSRRLGIISACCHIMNYFCPKSFLIQFCTWAPKNAHQKNWGKIQGGPLWIFAFQTTFATSVFLVPHKKCISHFSGARRGRNRCFLWRGHQGHCAKHDLSIFHGWGTY